MSQPAEDTAASVPPPRAARLEDTFYTVAHVAVPCGVDARCGAGGAGGFLPFVVASLDGPGAVHAWAFANATVAPAEGFALTISRFENDGSSRVVASVTGASPLELGLDLPNGYYSAGASGAGVGVSADVKGRLVVAGPVMRDV